jgi:hypothetical protein
MNIEVSQLLWGLSTLAAIVASHVRTSVLLGTTRSDVQTIKKRMGLSNGDVPIFTEREHCLATHANLQREIGQLSGRMEHAIERDEASIDESRHGLDKVRERIEVVIVEGATDRADLSERLDDYLHESKEDRLALATRMATIEGRVHSLFEKPGAA